MHIGSGGANVCVVVRGRNVESCKPMRDEATDINGEGESRLKTHLFIQQMY